MEGEREREKGKVGRGWGGKQERKSERVWGHRRSGKRVARETGREGRGEGEREEEGRKGKWEGENEGRKRRE